MKPWYNIAKKKKGGSYRDVFILDEIGGFGTSARNFIQELMQIDEDNINLHVDSPGGNITDGIAIYNALRAHPANVNVYINGMAGSISSIIILAGDNVYIPENGSIFTHLPMLSELDMPNRQDLQDGIDMLANFEKALANIYMKHTGADYDTVTSWMENETFFFGQDAVDAGLATEMVDKVELVAQYDATKYSFYKSLPQFEVDEETKNKTEVITMETLENTEAEATLEEEVVAEVEESASPTNLETSAEEAVVAEDATEAEATEEVEDLEAEEDETEVDANEILAYEESRKEGIMQVSAKYGDNAQLDKVTIEALAGDTTVEEYKDIVLEALAKAPSQKTLVAKQNNTKDESADEIRNQMAESKDPIRKGILARKLREIR